jgi:hypothetical protein
MMELYYHHFEPTNKLKTHMKKYITTILAVLSIVAHAATPEQEKAFIESYKKALLAKDSAALKAFLYTEGSESETIEFFTMMQESSAGMPISSIELVTPNKEEMEKFKKPMTMPNGKKYKLPFTPTKQLVITVEEKNGENSSKSTSTSPVGEKNGKLVIPVPVPTK